MRKHVTYIATLMTAAFISSTAFAADDALVVSDEHSIEGTLDSHHDTASHAAHHGADHASSGGLPQFDVTTYPSQLFWLFLTFATCYLIFSKKILPEISSVLQTRRERIDNDLQTAKELREEIESVREEYETAIAEARSQATSEMQEIQANSRHDAEAAAKDFNDRAVKEIAEVEKRAEGMKQDVMNDLRDIVAESATDIVKKIAECDVDQTEALKVLDGKLGTQKKAA